MSQFKELKKIVDQLRHPETGCPWDKKQTSKSLIPNFIEEIYEAVEAIEEEDNDLLKEELGDILLHIMLQVKIAEEKEVFTLDDVIKNINNKLLRRHPHIFKSSSEELLPILSTLNGEIEEGIVKINTSEEAKYNWEKIKLQEKKKERKSVVDGVPKKLPALIQAQRIQEKAASVGFDWNSYEPVFEKIVEEIEEVKTEIKLSQIEKTLSYENGEHSSLELDVNSQNLSSLEMEIGDLLFAVVNLSRKLKIDSETALRISTEKFKKRFIKVEKLCEEKQINMEELDLKTLDELWETIKKE